MQWPTTDSSVTLAEPKKSHKANGVLSHSILVGPSKVAPPLAAVDSIIDDALSYLRRGALSGHAKPLLLMGGKGSGKTVIAKTIGERLEQDRDVVAGKLRRVFLQADCRTHLQRCRTSGP